MTDLPDPTNLLRHQHPSVVEHVNGDRQTVAQADWREGVWFVRHWDDTRQYVAAHQIASVERLEIENVGDFGEERRCLEDLDRVWHDLPAETQEAIER